MRLARVATSVVLLLSLSGCQLMDVRSDRRQVARWGPSRWGPPVVSIPLISQPERTARESRGHLIDEVSVYGYDRGVTLHFSLKDHTLADLLDAAGGLPPPHRRGHE